MGRGLAVPWPSPHSQDLSSLVRLPSIFASILTFSSDRMFGLSLVILTICLFTYLYATTWQKPNLTQYNKFAEVCSCEATEKF